jgi:hypothetical protein
MKKRILEASKAHFEAHILKHQVNIETILNNPMAIPEHTDIMEAVEKELALMAEYDDKLEMLNKYFLND